MGYHTTRIDFGYKERISVYVQEVRTETKKKKEQEQGENRTEDENTQKEVKKKKKRKKYTEMSTEEKKKSDERRIRYYKKAIYDLVELACMNEDLESMVTLTFKENITDYKEAVKEWQNFLRKLRPKVDDLKYICIWEFQKRGAIHFHVLFNFTMEHDELSKIWRRGFVWITNLKNKNDTLREIKYMTKYMTKGIEKLQGISHERQRVRFFFLSDNLKKPTIETSYERIDLEKLIFENMENIISDGSYYLKDYENNIINRCDYVEIRK